jgi:hypothetical protein
MILTDDASFDGANSADENFRGVNSRGESLHGATKGDVSSGGESYDDGSSHGAVSLIHDGARCYDDDDVHSKPGVSYYAQQKSGQIRRHHRYQHASQTSQTNILSQEQPRHFPTMHTRRRRQKVE